MNEAANMNNDMGRSFFKFGIIALIVTAVLFIGKSLVGYERVTYYATIDNCTVRTWSNYRRMSRGSKTFYYISVSHTKTDTEVSIDFDKLYDLDEDYDIYSEGIDTEEEMLFRCEVPYMYYRKFENYRGSKVTFYKDTDGIYFPVFSVDSDRASAERAYRMLVPPYHWYLLYAIGALVGLVSIYLGIQAKRAANSYSELTTPYQQPFGQQNQQPFGQQQYQQPFGQQSHTQINTPEDALSYMATQRIRREKMEERMERRNRSRYRRF